MLGLTSFCTASKVRLQFLSKNTMSISYLWQTTNLMNQWTSLSNSAFHSRVGFLHQEQIQRTPTDNHSAVAHGLAYEDCRRLAEEHCMTELKTVAGLRCSLLTINALSMAR